MPRRSKAFMEALENSKAEEFSLFDSVGEESEKKRFRSKNPILDLLIRKIGTFPLLQKEELTDLFLTVEDLYTDAVQYLCEHSGFFELVVADNLAEVLGGITGGRIVHNFPTEDDNDETWANHAPFISHGLETLSQRLLKDRNGFNIKVCGLRLVGSTIFSALEAYQTLGNEYNEFSSELATLYLKDRRQRRRLKVMQRKMEDVARQLRTREDDIPILTSYVSDVLTKVRTAQQTVFNHHLRLLVKVATSHTKDSDQLLDNIQAGSFGLLRAIKDYVHPYNFIGYASSWIRQAVLSSMREYSNNIRIPGNVLQEHSALEKVRNKLPDEADVEILASHAKQDVKRVKKVYELIQLAHTWSLDREISTPDSPGSIKEGGTLTLGETIPDDSPSLDEREDTSIRVCEYLDLLEERQRWVVCCFYGLFDYLPNRTSKSYADSCKEERIGIERHEIQGLRQRLISANMRLQKRRLLQPH